jgi:hypothetical protein
MGTGRGVIVPTCRLCAMVDVDSVNAPAASADINVVAWEGGPGAAYWWLPFNFGATLECSPRLISKRLPSIRSADGSLAGLSVSHQVRCKGAGTLITRPGWKPGRAFGVDGSARTILRALQT